VRILQVGAAAELGCPQLVGHQHDRRVERDVLALDPELLAVRPERGERRVEAAKS
jgi:hypothetical protein